MPPPGRCDDHERKYRIAEAGQSGPRQCRTRSLAPRCRRDRNRQPCRGQSRAAITSTQDPATDVSATQAQVDQLIGQINAAVTSRTSTGQSAKRHQRAASAFGLHRQQLHRSRCGLDHHLDRRRSRSYDVCHRHQRRHGCAVQSGRHRRFRRRFGGHYRRHAGCLRRGRHKAESAAARFGAVQSNIQSQRPSSTVW